MERALVCACVYRMCVTACARMCASNLVCLFLFHFVAYVCGVFDLSMRITSKCVARTATMLKITPEPLYSDLVALLSELFVSILITL